MTTQKSASNLPQRESGGMTVVTNPDGTESYESHTPDSYDAHIVPAETAARKEREGSHFKHLDKHIEGSEHIATAGGVVVDKEGLLDNFAVEPEMYYETRGDIPSHASEVRQEKAHQEELHQEAIHVEAVRQEKLHQEEIRQEKLRQETLHQREIHEETVRQEKLYQEGVRQEKLHQDQIRQEAIHQDEMLREKVAKEKQHQEEVRLAEIQKKQLLLDTIYQNEIRHKDLHQEQLLHDDNGTLKLNKSAENISEEREMMSAKLGVGTFADYEKTELALGELKTTGFQMNRVSVVGRDIHNQIEINGVNKSDRLSDVGNNLHTDDNKSLGTAGDGAIAGAAIGGYAGLLVGLGLLIVPGFGPVLLTGAAATAIASAFSGGVIGAAAGSLAGGLVGLGIPEDQAELYGDRINQGDYLVILEGSTDNIDSADTIFRQHHIHQWHVYDLPNEAVGNVPVTGIPARQS